MASAHVQTQWNEAASAESISVTLTLTAGNGVVVSFISPNVGLSALVGLAQTAGDTLTLATSLDGSGLYTAQYVKQTVAGGSTTFTFAWTGATAINMFVTEVTNLAASPFDQSASSGFSIATTKTSGTTGTLSQADEFVVATFNLDGSGSTSLTSVSNGFTVPTNGDQMGSGHLGGRALLAYKVVSTTAGVETTLTVSDTIAASAIIATYKSATTGSSSVSPSASSSVSASASPSSAPPAVRFYRRRRG